MVKRLFARKPLSLLLEEMEGEHRLRRVLGPVQLTSLGIGCIIGAGIFVLTGLAARNIAGPSLIVSFVVAGTACVFAALCYAEFASMAPVARAFEQVGVHWAHFIISAGAIAGITSVLLVLMLSQPRVLLAMARDGLLPRSFFAAVHDRFRTPWKATILTGSIVAILAALLPLPVLAELVNIGTLLAFVIVCTAVLIMRRSHPDANRPFRCPPVPAVPISGIVLCLVLMFSLPAINWARLAGWLAIGLVIYFCYGRKRSVMARKRAETHEETPIVR